MPAPTTPPSHFLADGPSSRGATSALAITSLVLGLVWLCGAASVLALIFGIIALRQIDRSPPSAPIAGRGMAIAGIVLGAIGSLMLAGSILLVAAGVIASNDDPKPVSETPTSSSSSGSVKVPAVVGMSVDDAAAEILAAGLTYQTVGEPNEQFIASLVFEQSPASNAPATRGSVVILKGLFALKWGA